MGFVHVKPSLLSEMIRDNYIRENQGVERRLDAKNVEGSTVRSGVEGGI